MLVSAAMLLFASLGLPCTGQHVVLKGEGAAVVFSGPNGSANISQAGDGTILLPDSQLRGNLTALLNTQTTGIQGLASAVNPSLPVNLLESLAKFQLSTQSLMYMDGFAAPSLSAPTFSPGYQPFLDKFLIDTLGWFDNSTKEYVARAAGLFRVHTGFSVNSLPSTENAERQCHFLLQSNSRGDLRLATSGSIASSTTAGRVYFFAVDQYTRLVSGERLSVQVECPGGGNWIAGSVYGNLPGQLRRAFAMVQRVGD